MRSQKLILLILLIIPLGAVAFAQGIIAPDNWEVIGTGIEFQQYQLTNPVPVNIFVARMDRNNAEATIESSIAQGRLSGGAETVSGIAERYDQAINYWGPPTIPVSQTWGSRNDVVVAINGFYYGGDVEPPGVPWSGQVHSGWYAKRYYNLESTSGFVWKMDRSTFIGECITHPTEKQVVYIAYDEEQYNFYIDGINEPRDNDELVLYTPQYDSDTGTNANNGIEVLIEMEKPTSISEINDAMPKGIIREVRDNKGSTPILFDHVVLSAHGTAASELRATDVLTKGSSVAIAQKVKDCIPTNDWSYAYAGVGGQFYFLRNGEIFPYENDGQANVRDPRTAIAYNDEFIFFIVADGRNPGISEGMTVAEMANFAKNILGATDAIMQDGGGSSTMVVKRQEGFQVVNNTFCNNVFCKHKIYLPLVLNSSASATTSEYQPLQRLVANGMMMVGVESMKQSETYSPGNSLVATNSETDLYLGPGTNYGILAPISSDTIGQVIDHPNNLDGVLAKKAYWWLVDFDGTTGWVSEESLTIQLKSAPAGWKENANQFR